MIYQTCKNSGIHHVTVTLFLIGSNHIEKKTILLVFRPTHTWTSYLTKSVRLLNALVPKLKKSDDHVQKTMKSESRMMGLQLQLPVESANKIIAEGLRLLEPQWPIVLSKGRRR